MSCPYASASAAFWSWVDEYVCRPHAEIGRRGVVCPFVPGMRRAGGLRVEVDLAIDGTDAAALEARVRAAIPVFEAIPLDARKKSLVLLFPNLGEQHGATLDQVQAALKPDAVRLGLMLGQFHPASMEPAARNPGFLANRCPVPALAIRHMATHDILFLDHDREMFAAYDARFGERFARGRVPDRYLVGRYEAACASVR